MVRRVVRSARSPRPDSLDCGTSPYRQRHHSLFLPLPVPVQVQPNLKLGLECVFFELHFKIT